MISHAFIFYLNLGPKSFISFYTIIEGSHCGQHSWKQRTVAALIMVSPMMTDTEPNLINCSAISFDNLVDSSTKLCRHGLVYQKTLRQDSQSLIECRGEYNSRIGAFILFLPIKSLVGTAWASTLFNQTFCPSELFSSKTLFLIMAKPEVTTCE